MRQERLRQFRRDPPCAPRLTCLLVSLSPIFLIGPRGSGKTTVARLLAERLGWDWVDADDVLEARHGKSVRDIFAEEGEAGFRDKESAVLAELCERRSCVVATGGGVVVRRGQPRLAAGVGPCRLADGRRRDAVAAVQDDERTADRRPALTVGGRTEVEEVVRSPGAVVSRVRPPDGADGRPDGGRGRRRGPRSSGEPGRVSARRWRPRLLRALTRPGSPLEKSQRMLYIWVAFAFVIGAMVGSFLNVCVARLPFEKSILWPLGSRCGRCFQSIRACDNIPIISWWLLRGRCRSCGQPFSISYSLVELFTACAFAGLFYLEVGRNILDLPFLREPLVQWQIEWGMVPWQAWVVWGWHATLVSFLLVTSLCDVQYLEVPLGVTVCGTLVGLIGATFLAWPFPAEHLVKATPGRDIPPGLYPWPVWPPWQLPTWLPEFSLQLGLATGLAGALAGMIVLRAVRFLFGLGRGKEGLGIGDADVMMMAGSFIGWQPTLVAFFIGVFVALFFGVIQLIRSGDQALAFGPALAIGAVVTLLAWPTLGRIPTISMLFSEPVWIGGLGAVGAVFLLLASFVLRIVRGSEPPEAPAGPESKAEPLASPPTPLPQGARGENDAPLPSGERGRGEGADAGKVEEKPMGGDPA